MSIYFTGRETFKMLQNMLLVRTENYDDGDTGILFRKLRQEYRRDLIALVTTVQSIFLGSSLCKLYGFMFQTNSMA